MKTLFYALLAVLVATSCNDDDDKSSIDKKISEINSTVTSGKWAITYFYESDDDHTSDFTGYEFTFGSGTSNNLTATKGATTYTGSWSTTNDDDSDDDNPDYEDIDFNISFSAPPTFAELTEDWEIVAMTSTKIQLRHVSGGDGDIDFLTFEKI